MSRSSRCSARNSRTARSWYHIDPVYREREDLSEDGKKHCSQVSHADRQLGAVLDKLRELGLEEHNRVLFASVNGPTEEPSLEPASYQAGGGLRGYKRNLYEGGVRVPLIAWGRAAPTTVSATRCRRPGTC
ncbi:sulfatase-like hydrolase/transferase [Streptomyces oceani]|uniref:sulfatase-like hydrolase/transferase n=1 Tax=Streptomyces oceani TaxID=1075402 RepID=UPI00087209D1|nr:sulfatase-like hydrolase/transferase [Streptomyces oceani]